jgi:hypothetical protein
VAQYCSSKSGTSTGALPWYIGNNVDSPTVARFFGEDAQIASKVLGIACFADRNFLTAYIPVAQLPNFL